MWFLITVVGWKRFEKNKPGRGGVVIQEQRVYEQEQYFIVLLYIFTLYKFWNLCDLSKRRSLLHLIFWAPIFCPARVVTAMKISLK